MSLLTLLPWPYVLLASNSIVAVLWGGFFTLTYFFFYETVGVKVRTRLNGDTTLLK